MTTSHAAPTTDAGAHAGSGDTQVDSDATMRRRPRKPWLLLGVAILTVAGATLWFSTRSGAELEPVEPPQPAVTAEVVRETIADTRSFAGTLGHGAADTVTAVGPGVITRLAEQGTEVTAGTELFRVDEQPVTALHGTIPMYRDLQHGDSGADVAQLITNLSAMGHADCEATDEITSCVREAIRSWQEDTGRHDSGIVARSDVVFVPEGSRVDTIHARVGGVVSPGAEVVDLTGSDQVVSLDVAVRDRDLLTVDTEVVVELPGGGQAAGTVTAANVVPFEDDAITNVEVTLDEVVDVSFLGAPADVIVEVDQRADVLTVPVNALLALAESGYGVEVVGDDGRPSIVPVQTGLFASGRVEIIGGDLAAGTVVVVAGR